MAGGTMERTGQLTRSSDRGGGGAEEKGWSHRADSKSMTDGDYASISLYDDGSKGNESRKSTLTTL